MATFEKAEKLREKANISYDEAREALDASNDDLLDAFIFLEKKGKVTPPKSGGQYSSGYARYDNNAGYGSGYEADNSADRGADYGDGARANKDRGYKSGYGHDSDYGSRYGSGAGAGADHGASASHGYGSGEDYGSDSYGGFSGYSSRAAKAAARKQARGNEKYARKEAERSAAYERRRAQRERDAYGKTAATGILSEIGALLAKALRAGNNTRVGIEYRGKRVANIPLTLCALAVIVFFKIAVIGFIASLIFGVRFSLSGQLADGLRSGSDHDKTV